MILTNAALDTINKNMVCKNRLALEMDKSQYTIQRWINTNDEMLTTASALKVIREETGLSDDEILTETVAAEK